MLEENNETVETINNEEIQESPLLNDAGNLDYDNLPDEVVDRILENGGEIPDDLREQIEADKSPEQAADESAEDETNEEAEVEQPADVSTFEFTADADDETFARESEEFLSRFEDSPEMEKVKQIVDGYKSRFESASAVNTEIENYGGIETVRRTQSAIDDMVSRSRQDGEIFVPETASFRKMMQEHYPNEYFQIFNDELGQESKKYAGLTQMEELVAEGFGFKSPQAVEKLVHFLHKKESSVPSYLPAGIDEKVGEAFWKAVDRRDIEAKLAGINDVLAYVMSGDGDDIYDATDKAEAQRDLDAINKKLAQIQVGLNADKQAAADAQNKQVQARQEFENSVMASYQTDAITLEREFSDKISARLTMFGEHSAAAKLTARSMATLVRDALSENEEFAKAARTDLKEMGVSYDWQKGFAALDRLYQINREIKSKEANPNRTSPRSLEISKQTKANIIREIKAQETELVGKMMQIVQTGANVVLKSKAATANGGGKLRLTPTKNGVATGAKVQSHVNASNKDDAKFAHLSDTDLAKFAEAEQILNRNK